MAFNSGFTIVPNELWEHAELSKEARLTFAALCRYRNHETGEAWPSIEKIMGTAGIGRRNTVSKALKQLADYGLIKIRKRPAGSIYHNSYVVRDPDYSESPYWEPTEECEKYRRAAKERNEALSEILVRAREERQRKRGQSCADSPGQSQSDSPCISNDTQASISNDTQVDIVNDTQPCISNDTVTDYNRPVEQTSTNTGTANAARVRGMKVLEMNECAIPVSSRHFHDLTERYGETEATDRVYNAHLYNESRGRGAKDLSWLAKQLAGDEYWERHDPEGRDGGFPLV